MRIEYAKFHSLFPAPPTPEQIQEQLTKKRKSDGFYFRKHPWVNTKTSYTSDIDELESRSNVEYITLETQEGVVFNKDVGSYRFLILLFEPVKNNPKESEVIYFKAILGDPVLFILRHLRKDAQGLVIKDGITGYNRLLNILKGYPPSIVTKQVGEDALACLKELTRRKSPCVTLSSEELASLEPTSANTSSNTSPTTTSAS